MKLAIEPRTVVVDGVLATQQFSFKAGAHAMEIMADLYSDTYWAIVREYGTNMLDAYIRLKLNGQTPLQVRPPEIHLPTALSPFIMFRDFGVGMDHDTVFRVYTTFFESLKNGNNDEIGGLGLGAKVAFSYTAQWIVESRWHGEIRIYNASKSEAGIPRLDLMHTGPTEEPNGVTVKIPVPTGDFSRFIGPVNKLAMYFPMELVVKGAGTWVTPSREYVTRAAAWGLTKIPHSSQVVMGNIPYPIEVGKLVGDRCAAFALIKEMHWKHSVDLYVPVGSVHFTPSREALKYTSTTLDVLEEAATQFMNQLVETVLADIQAAPTKWKATELLYEAAKMESIRERLRGVEWRGQPLTWVGLVVSLGALKARIPAMSVFAMQNKGPNFKRFDPYVPARMPVVDTHSEDAEEDDESSDLDALSDGVTVIPGHTFHLVIDDLPDDAKRVAAAARMKHFLNLTYGHAAQQGWGSRRSRRRGAKPAKAYVFRVPQADVETVLEAFGGLDYSYMSDMDDPPRAHKAPSGVKTPTKGHYRTVSTASEEFTKERTLVDEDAGGLYVTTVAGEPQGGLSLGLLSKIYATARNASLIPADMPLVLLPASALGLTKRKNWFSFVEWLTPIVAKEFKRTAQDRANYEEWRGQYDDLLRFVTEGEVEEAIRAKRPRSPIIPLIDQYRAYQKTPSTSEIERLADWLNVTDRGKPKTAKKTVDALRAVIARKHPVFHLIAEHLSVNGMLQHQELLISLIVGGDK